jgi:hypothetical protein
MEGLIMSHTKRRTAAVGTLVALTLILSLSLTACGEKSAEPEATADDLFSTKSEYVGSAPDDIKLLDVLGVPDLGAYTIELKTDEKPYSITINFSELNEAGPDIDAKMKIRAPIILALISNVDEVHWTVDGDKNSYTVSDWKDKNGTDIKSYGDSTESISDLLNTVGYSS